MSSEFLLNNKHYRRNNLDENINVSFNHEILIQVRLENFSDRISNNFYFQTIFDDYSFHVNE